MPEILSDQREFERHLAGFSISVTAVTEDEKHATEQATIHDISGSGVSFTSVHPELYRLGQQLNIAIDLPAAGEKCARMQGIGMIVRITPVQGNSKPDQVQIGIRLEQPLSFEETGVEQQ